jgi:hypothetical protein
MFIFTLHLHLDIFHFTLPLNTGPFTITYHYQVPHFYHVLNKSSQALAAVSSSGHIRISCLIRISVHVLMSRYHSHTAFAQFRFSTRDFPALRAPIAPLFPRFRLIARHAFPLELSPVDTSFLRFP